MPKILLLTCSVLFFCVFACGDNAAPIEAPDAGMPSCHEVTPNACSQAFPGAGLTEEACDPGVDLRHPKPGQPTDCFEGDGLICCKLGGAPADAGIDAAPVADSCTLDVAVSLSTTPGQCNVTLTVVPLCTGTVDVVLHAFTEPSNDAQVQVSAACGQSTSATLTMPCGSEGPALGKARMADASHASCEGASS